MPQLEHALGLLAERAVPIPVDVLLERLDAQLAAGETEPDTVTAPEPDSLLGPTVRDGLSVKERQSRWRGPLIAAGTAAAILALVPLTMFFLGADTGDVTMESGSAITTPAIQDDTTIVSTSIDATWSYMGKVDDWLTDPVMVNGTFYTTRKGLDDDAQPNWRDGLVEGGIEEVGELWTSPNGVTWLPAVEGERSPPASPGTRTDGAEVVVQRNPIADNYGMLVADGLWATSDGRSWREIALRPSQDNWIPSVETGEFGWVVYSPPIQATVEADVSSAFQGPRNRNLGLWYTPDTEAWFEVTDLGPLADAIHSVGEVGVIDTAMIIRNNNILVYVHIAKNVGFGFMGDPHTEIWQLDLSLGEPAETFDF